MNFVTLTLGLVAVLLALLLGRTLVLNNLHLGQCKKHQNQIKKLRRRIYCISYDTEGTFDIEEDGQTEAYNVIKKIKVNSTNGDFDTYCYCLIKQFPFDDDKAFALREAEELLEKLNE